MHGQGACARLTVACAILIGMVAAPAAQAAEQRAYAVGMNYATPAVTMGQGDKLQNAVDEATKDGDDEEEQKPA